MTDCVFCNPDYRPTDVIIEDLDFYAKLDPYPAAPGHILVIPRNHIVSFFDLTTAEVARMYACARAAAEYLPQARPALGYPDGWTIGINDGEAAGRTIEHLHLHLIPRYQGDQADPRGGIRRIMVHPAADPWLTHLEGQT